jgi:type I restriction enzyme S subunit
MELMRTTATATEIEKFHLRRDDVLITKDSESWDDIGIPALVVDSADDLLCGYHLAILRPDKSKLDGRFLFRCLQARDIRIQLEMAADGVTRFGIPKDAIGKLQLPIPSLAEQRTIAGYLDRETGRLDALVAAKERWLELLAEKRRALITRAVTRGLNPAAPLRDSGFPWLGQVPKHWEIWKMSHFARVWNGSTPRRDNVEYWSGGDIPWLNSSVVNQNEVTCSDQFVTETALNECHLPMVSIGSILVGLTGQGKTRGQAVVLSVEATINQHLAFITPEPIRADSWYLRWLFFANHSFLRAISDDAGGTKGALTCEQLSELKLALPPLAEQRAIVAHIATATAKLDGLRAAAERTIALLKERRAALIAAAVTGKIAVPTRPTSDKNYATYEN